MDPARLRFAADGRLVKLHFGQSPAAQWNGELFCDRGGKRGRCMGFSWGSRRRLLDHLNTVSKGAALPYFLTLTLPDDVFCDDVSEFARRGKVWLDVFLKRLRRVCGTAAGFWRMEWKARQSGAHVGRLFPHFHLLVWGLPVRVMGGGWEEAYVDVEDRQLGLQLLDLWSESSKAKTDWKYRVETSGRVFAGSRFFVSRAQNLNDLFVLSGESLASLSVLERAALERLQKLSFQDWASLAWYHVVDSHNLDHLQAGSRCERIRSWGGVMWYCAKYLAKDDSGFLAELPLGRSWGIFNRGFVPWAKIVEIDLAVDVAVRLRRVARRYLEHRFGRRFRLPYGVTIYGNVDLWRRLWELVPIDAPF